jgi:hypothetical protein
MRFDRKLMVKTLGAKRAFATERIIMALKSKLSNSKLQIKEPIFIWTTGRSGSYLFYDFVSQHPSLTCKRTYSRLNKGIYGHENYGKFVSKDFDSLQYHFPPVEGKTPFILRDFPNLKHGELNENDITEEVIVKVRNNYSHFFNLYGDRNKRFLDKAPQYTFLFPLINTIFPDAKHCYFVRNPIDTFHSTLKRYENKIGIFDQGVWGWRPIRYKEYKDKGTAELVANILIDTYEQAESNIQALDGKYCFMRYEDFLSSPQQEVNRFFAYVGMETISIDAFKEFILKNTKSNNDLSVLSRDTEKRLNYWVEKYGYL